MISRQRSVILVLGYYPVMQRKRSGLIIVLAFVAILLAGCGWTQYLRLSIPETPQKWGRVGIFPADGMAHKEAEGAVEGIIFDLMGVRLPPGEVIRPGTLRSRLNDEALRQMVADYSEKLYILNFSHPELSKKIGVALEVDTFLFSRIEYWGYSLDRKKRNEARVGMSLIAIEASSGRVLWRGVRYESRDFLFLKPELTGVARSLLRRMVAEFPI